MEENQKNIDDLFRDELSGYAETPPPAAWDALEKKLAARPRGAGIAGNRLKYLALLGLVLLLTVTLVRNIPGSMSTGSNGVADNHLPAAGNTGNPHTAGAGSNGTTPAPNTSNNGAALADAAAGTNVPGAEQANSQAPANNQQENSNNVNNTNTTINEHRNTTANNKQNNTATGPDKHSKTVAAKNNKKQPAANKGNKNSSTTAQPVAAGNRTMHNSDEQAAQNIYSSKLSNPAPVTEDANDATGNNDKPAENKKPQPAANKNLVAAKNNNAVKPKAPKPYFKKFELGIKVGYEASFDNDGAKKLVVSPYLQYNISPKFSIMTQPGIKTAQADSRRIGNPASYYKVNSDDRITQSTDSVIVLILPYDSMWIWKNAYSQSHDSIVKTYTMRNSYMELEIPLLLRYAISKTFSVYGGVNIVYSQLMGIDEKTFTRSGILITDTVKTLGYAYASPPTPRPIDGVITYTGNPLSSYTGPLYTGSNEGTWRVGYMLGFSYGFNKRWMMDGLIQQTSVKPNIQAKYDVNTALSAPYFRFTIGYKLLK